MEKGGSRKRGWGMERKRMGKGKGGGWTKQGGRTKKGGREEGGRRKEEAQKKLTNHESETYLTVSEKQSRDIST